VTSARIALGAAGEARAARWYEAHGYGVLARNWRAPGRQGELDLVVAKRGLLVFVEVKTRRTARFGVPAEAVTPDKQRRIHGLAAAYVRETEARGRWRFDVVSILAGELTVLEAAF
jgi:putative endonuclease